MDYGFVEFDLGAFICRIRKRSKFKSASAFAKELTRLLHRKPGIATETVSRWENNHMRPDIETIEAMLKLIGIRLDDLLKLPGDFDPMQRLVDMVADRMKQENGNTARKEKKKQMG